MRLSARRIVKYLIAGAVVNVAVAWGCALWSPIIVDHILFDSSGFSSDERSHYERLLPLRRNVGEHPTDSFGITMTHGFGFGIHLIGLDTRHIGRDPHDMGASEVGILTVRCGFPLSCFKAVHSANDWPFWRWSAGPRNGVWTGGAAIPDWMRPVSDYGWFFRGVPRALPLRPQMTGLLLGTFFYPSCVMIVSRGIACWRGRSRARRGLCPSCAYPAAGLPRCSECGHPAAPGIPAQQSSP